MGRLPGHRPLIMGILNVTPDSFYDGGRFLRKEDAVAHALKMVEEGADIVDVGGESTRPFSSPTPAEDELKRVIPVIEEIRRRTEVLISIDTYKAEVAKRAIEAGAGMINDISGLTFDEGMVGVARHFDGPVVVMHTKGRPADMQRDPHYDDVVEEISRFFEERLNTLEGEGIERDRIILDPGIGFGKRAEDNMRILKHLEKFKVFGRPLLVGTSMKSFIGAVTDSPLEERLPGTLASVVLAFLCGADIFRVHNVKATYKALRFVESFMRA